MIYQTEKTLKEMGDKVNAADKQRIEDAVATLKKAIEGGDTADIKSKTEALQQAAYKIAEEMYKQQGTGAAGAAGAGAAGGAADSGPTKGTADDVDYEVVKDEDK